MSNQNTLNAESPRHKGRRRSRHGFFTGLLAGAFLGGILIVTINAYSHFNHGGPFGHGMQDPAVAMERAEFAIDWTLSRVDASEAQREQVKAIVNDAFSDLQPAIAEHRVTHEAFRDLFAQPTIDRLALEQLRTAALEQADSVSSRVIQAIADAAEVLTPAQRAALIALADRNRH
ncbi:MAG: Spy/CpxP family protein refolding chaperone [Acidiferrobacterales bacterium]